MRKVGGRRNYGFGKKISFAMSQALLDCYGEGRFGTRHTHFARCRQFKQFLATRGIKDLRIVTKELVIEYGVELADRVVQDELSVNTAQNRLSTLNVVLTHMRKDKNAWVSPVEVVGPRKHVRETVPLSMDLEKVRTACASLRAAGHEDLASAVEFCRGLGTRVREAALFNVPDAIRQLDQLGIVNIVDGTKGGRKVYRPVQVRDDTAEALRRALVHVSAHGNLIPADMSWIQWSGHAYRDYKDHARKAGLHTGFHDLRAAYACDRYRELTGHDAPVVAGSRLASKEADEAARVVIAQELGHGRPSIVASYCGSSR